MVVGKKIKKPWTGIKCTFKSCIAYLVTLWALKEIEQSQDEEITVRLNYQEVLNRLIKLAPFNRFFQRFGIETPHDRDLAGGFLRTQIDCPCCFKLRYFVHPDQEPPLEAVRSVIIELYSYIFQYQVWDVKTGKPVLKQLFAGDAQLDAFTYFSHFGYVFSDFNFETVFSKGVIELGSICNFQLLSAINRTGRLDIFCRNVLEKEFKISKAMEIEMKRLKKKILFPRGSN